MGDDMDGDMDDVPSSYHSSLQPLVNTHIYFRSSSPSPPAKNLHNSAKTLSTAEGERHYSSPTLHSNAKGEKDTSAKTNPLLALGGGGASHTNHNTQYQVLSTLQRLGELTTAMDSRLAIIECDIAKIKRIVVLPSTDETIPETPPFNPPPSPPSNIPPPPLDPPPRHPSPPTSPPLASQKDDVPP
ncbi:hypothetical protein LXL04_023402 [Taraxacum kok-saghyz]